MRQAALEAHSYPTPDKDGQDDTLALLRGDVRRAKGSMLFVESMANDFQGGSQQVPADWAQNSLRYDGSGRGY